MDRGKAPHRLYCDSAVTTSTRFTVNLHSKHHWPFNFQYTGISYVSTLDDNLPHFMVLNITALFSNRKAARIATCVGLLHWFTWRGWKALRLELSIVWRAWSDELFWNHLLFQQSHLHNVKWPSCISRINCIQSTLYPTNDGTISRNSNSTIWFYIAIDAAIWFFWVIHAMAEAKRMSVIQRWSV